MNASAVATASTSTPRASTWHTSVSTPERGLQRRVLAHTQKLMVIHHTMDKDWVGERHSHPHEQAVYVISGHLRVCCGDESFDVHGGDSFVVEGGVEHQAWAIESSVVLDVFTPVREEYATRPQAQEAWPR